jgi:hypothetical protein
MVLAQNAARKIALSPLRKDDPCNCVQFLARAGAQIKNQFGRVTARSVTRLQPNRE